MKQEDKLSFRESCEFYCNYHKVSGIKRTMICGNLQIVVDRLLESQKKELTNNNNKVETL